MSLIVENGTGLPDADSYLSLADAATYHTKWGNAAWAALASDAVREVALLKATRYIDAVYKMRWFGERSLTTQALDWPRRGTTTRDNYYVAENVVPAKLKEAVAELALKSTTEDILPDQEDSGIVESESITIDTISFSTSYQGGRTPFKKYSLVERLLSELISAIDGGMSVGQMVRS